MSQDEARKALEECEEDTSEDARAASEAQDQPEPEPVLPLIHSSEQSAELAGYWMRRLRTWRASRSGRPSGDQG